MTVSITCFSINTKNAISNFNSELIKVLAKHREQRRGGNRLGKLLHNARGENLYDSLGEGTTTRKTYQSLVMNAKIKKKMENLITLRNAAQGSIFGGPQPVRIANVNYRVERDPTRVFFITVRQENGNRRRITLFNLNSMKIIGQLSQAYNTLPIPDSN